MVLWHGASVLREHRGDGHIAALTLAGVSGIEALVMHAATGDVPSAILQTTRAWPDEAWSEALARLTGRGRTHADGSFTDEGRAVRDDIEGATDRAAAAPWGAIGGDGCARLRELVRPWSKAMAQSRCEQRGHRLSRRADVRPWSRRAGAALVVGSHTVLPRHLRSPRRRRASSRSLPTFTAAAPWTARMRPSDCSPRSTRTPPRHSCCRRRQRCAGSRSRPTHRSVQSGSRWARRGRSGSRPSRRHRRRVVGVLRRAGRRLQGRGGGVSRPIGPSTTNSSTTTRSRSSKRLSASRGRPVEFHRYPGTGHWFFESDRPPAFDAGGRRARVAENDRLPTSPPRRLSPARRRFEHAGSRRRRGPDPRRPGPHRARPGSGAPSPSPA